MSAADWRLGVQPVSTTEPCLSCAACQSNLRDLEEVRQQRLGGNDIEVLGQPKPCERQQAARQREALLR